MSAACLELCDLEKRFFGVPVLRDVCLRIDAGKVVGLVGENGAGKSTLMNLLGGILRPDRGQILLGGQPFAPRTPAEATREGVVLVHQELNLFSNLTVAENLLLTSFPCLAWPGGWWINRRESRRLAREALAKVQLEIPVDTPLEQLAPGQRQLTEIAKVLLGNPRAVLLDEPTTSLTEPECVRLFEIIRQLRSQGTSVIYISHNLAHVRQLCDEIVVLRDGQIQAVGEANEFDLDRMISLMVGRSLEQSFPQRAACHDGKVVLEVEGLTRRGVLRDVSFRLHAGELVGISGLMGAGRTELVRMLFGLDRFDRGTIRLNGRPLIPSPRECIRHGMAIVTENRRDDGLLMPTDVEHNLALASLKRFSLRPTGWFDRARSIQRAKQMTERLRIDCRRVDGQSVKTLSGGNQQKVVLGKWLYTEPQIVILDEPTRGIDVGAKLQIYQLASELVERGAAVLIVSSELEELVGLCDRILVMTAGEIRREMRREQFDRELLLHAAFGEERLT